MFQQAFFLMLVNFYTTIHLWFFGFWNSARFRDFIVNHFYIIAILTTEYNQRETAFKKWWNTSRISKLLLRQKFKQNTANSLGLFNNGTARFVEGDGIFQNLLHIKLHGLYPTEKKIFYLTHCHINNIKENENMKTNSVLIENKLQNEKT